MQSKSAVEEIGKVLALCHLKIVQATCNLKRTEKEFYEWCRPFKNVIAEKT